MINKNDKLINTIPEKSNNNSTHSDARNDEYTFINPGKIAIKTRTKDQKTYVDTSGEKWSWKNGGISYSIDWSKITLSNYIVNILKSFICYSLQARSPGTVSLYSSFIKNMSKFNIDNELWSDNEWVIKLFYSLDTISRNDSISLRVFYKWSCDRNISGFNKQIYINLKEIKLKKHKPYQKIYLQQGRLSLEDEAKILTLIRKTYNPDNKHDLQLNIVLHMAFELAPRAIQFHSIDSNDLEVNKSKSSGESFYTLWLPMAKKIGQSQPERRPRAISDELGNKIVELIALNEEINNNNLPALFVSSNGKRQPSTWFSKVIKEYFDGDSINTLNGLTTLFRHHMGQGLADQGAPADVIAESLGHNSTVPARAYIASTPTIADIKTRALGKSQSYNEIMDMMLTGNIITKADVTEERSVKGVVDMQYIGGIGGCGLPQATPCSYNPIYSCYTCKKFHPFIDGNHDKVKEALRYQAQKFIDTAESEGDIEYNRSTMQLEMTIEAVNATISRCKKYKDTHSGNEYD